MAKYPAGYLALDIPSAVYQIWYPLLDIKRPDIWAINNLMRMPLKIQQIQGYSEERRKGVDRRLPDATAEPRPCLVNPSEEQNQYLSG